MTTRGSVSIACCDGKSTMPPAETGDLGADYLQHMATISGKFVDEDEV